MESKYNVLFLCTHNSARSQMAEAFLKKYGSGLFNAYSAGFEPTKIDPMTQEVMREIGLEMEGQCAKGVETYLGKLLVHYLIIVCQAADSQCPHTWPGIYERLSWPFEDPAATEGGQEERLRKFRHVRDQIEQRIKVWLEDVSPCAEPHVLKRSIARE
jgi:arsenate reductase